MKFGERQQSQFQRQWPDAESDRPRGKPIQYSIGGLEYTNVIPDSLFLVLRNAFCYPGNISYLLGGLVSNPSKL